MRALVGTADQGPLDATVLIAQRDLQVKDLLAMALEAEVPRFDDAGVNGTDRDLVDLLAFDAEKIRDADDRSFVRLPAPRVVAGAIRAMEANRLEPGMPLGTDPVLLGKFPLEEVDLRAVGRQRRETGPSRGSSEPTRKSRAGAVGEDGVDIDVAGRLGDVAEEGGNSLSAASLRRRRSRESPRTAAAGPVPAESLARFARTRSLLTTIIA